MSAVRGVSRSWFTLSVSGVGPRCLYAMGAEVSSAAGHAHTACRYRTLIANSSLQYMPTKEGLTSHHSILHMS